MILSSKPAQRVWCLGMSWGSKLPWRWHLDGQLADITLEGLLALAIAGVASGAGYRFVAFVTQVLSQLSVQGSLDQQLGQLLEQAVLADEVFRLLVDGQQARQQLFGYVVFLGAYCAYGQAGLRRRWLGRLHKILHTLPEAGSCLKDLFRQSHDSSSHLSSLPSKAFAPLRCLNSFERNIAWAMRTIARTALAPSSAAT